MPPLHVLVAHDSEPIRAAVRRMLEDAGLQVTLVADGAAAVAALEARPDALVLDAAIGGVFSYEVVEELKRRGLPTRTLLVASIYNRAGYKRRPTSLHGADDYVEQHLIADQLLGKIGALLGVSLPPEGGAGASAPGAGPLGEPVDGGGAGRLRIRYATRAEGLELARRLANLIVADIAHYNRDVLAMPDPAEREARLREDMEEGRLLFDLRVPREIREGRDFVGEALEEWLRRPEGKERSGGGGSP